MASHDEIRKKLSLAASGALEPREWIEVQRHVLTCETCRRELAVLQVYTGTLGKLPAPAVPAGLAERTQALAQERLEASVRHRSQGKILVLLSLFSWPAGAATWVMARLLLGMPALALFARPGAAAAWSLAWTVLAWSTTGIAGILLRKKMDWIRRPL